MPEKNPFEYLSLDEETVKQLLKLSDKRIEGALSPLRRFLTLVFHPDITGVDNERIRLMHSSFELLEDPVKLRSFARAYLNRTKEPSVVTEQARWYQDRYREATAGNNLLQQETEHLKTELQTTTTSLTAHRAVIFGDVGKKEGRVYLPDIPSFDYLLELLADKTKDWYSIEQDYKFRNARRKRGHVAYFAGGVSHDELPSEVLLRASKIFHSDIFDDTELYHVLGRRLRPYLENGMYAILGAYPPQDKSILQVFGRVLEVRPKT